MKRKQYLPKVSSPIIPGSEDIRVCSECGNLVKRFSVAGHNRHRDEYGATCKHCGKAYLSYEFARLKTGRPR